MISYKPLFCLLIKREMTKTELRRAVGFGTMQLAKMSRNEYVSLEVIDRICTYLDCKIEDVIEYVPDKEENV